MAKEIKTPLGNAPVLPLLMIVAGGYLAWFGIHYWRRDVRWPSDPIKAVLQGKPIPDPGAVQPASAQLTADIQSYSGGASPTAGGTATGNSIADDALKYKGEGYVWGGNASKPGQWDCSSFVSYVLGHDLGLPLPGGHWNDPGFPPNAHGPTTVQYLLYGQQIARNQVGAGDLVVWQTHIGIAISGQDIISARDPAEGTGTSGIEGTSSSLGETAHYRRVGHG
jgi:cell wall-associated NlpC family hydrolase